MKAFLKNLFILVRFIPIYLWEMTTSNIRVATDVFRRKPHFAPGFLEIDMTGYNDLQRWGTICLITMSPGSLSLDIQEGSDKLEVHALYMHDPEETKRRMTALVQRAFGKPEVATS